MALDSYIQTIIGFFKSLNIDDLRHHLKDEHTYEDTTKEIFLDEIEKVFESHKNSGDTELIIYPGICASKTCPNCGKKGYRFVGNHSKNYMDLLFDIEGDDMKDIYGCVNFKTDAEIEDLGVKVDININVDDQNSFNKTPEYWLKVNAANAALKEIVTTPPRQLDFNGLSNWVDKHSITDELIGSFDPFDPCMKWTEFSMLYSELKKIRDYLSDHISEIRTANSELNLIKTEKDLIEWLLKYEEIGNSFPFYLECTFKKEEDHFKWNYQNPIHFKDDVFVDAMHFIEYFQNHHKDMLDKYTIYTNEEASVLSHINDTFLLKFHLEYRNEKEEAGIHIPLYINKQIDPSYLFDGN